MQRFTRLLGAIAILALCAATAAACATAKRRSANVPAHVPTWAFDDGCNGGTGASSSLVRGWVTYAESHCGPAATKALRDCHQGPQRFCAVMQYLDAEWYFPADGVAVARAANSSWWLHPPHGGPTISSSSLSGGYLLNQANPAVDSFFQAYVRDNYDSSDGLLMDWQSPSLAQELYYSSCGCQSTAEISSDQQLRASHEQMAAALTHRDGSPFLQADNTLPSNPYEPQGFDMLDHATGVDGWVTEGMPETAGQFDPYYSTLLDQIAYLTRQTSAFIVLLSRSAAGASYQQQTRRVQEATILLGYQPNQLVDWADLEEGNGQLAVWPEEGIVPAQPIESMRAPGGSGCLAGHGAVCGRGGHNDLRVAPGVFRRAFRACYRRGVAFGPCAAIINTTGHPVTIRARWLGGLSLHHEITFVGGDVQSGGALDLRGPSFRAGSTTVPADDAALLAR